jgi:hypothetical protein
MTAILSTSPYQSGVFFNYENRSQQKRCGSLFESAPLSAWSPSFHYIILSVCQVDKMAPEGAREKNIIIKGPADAVEAAKRLISEKIGGDPYGTVRS